MIETGIGMVAAAAAGVALAWATDRFVFGGVC